MIFEDAETGHSSDEPRGCNCCLSLGLQVCCSFAFQVEQIDDGQGKPGGNAGRGWPHLLFSQGLHASLVGGLRRPAGYDKGQGSLVLEGSWEVQGAKLRSPVTCR